MSLNYYCKTDFVVALVGFHGKGKAIVFPLLREDYPGWHFENKALTPINDQIVEHIAKAINQDKNKVSACLKINYEFCGNLVIPEEKKVATLYSGFLEGIDPPPEQQWRVLPELLRNMKKNRSRIEYIKAWQLLTGAMREETRVVEINDIIEKIDSL